MNYLNTKPLIYGLERSPMKEMIELSGDYPARLAETLIRGDIDLGLIPVAMIPKMKESHIVGNYCIGTEGEIASVALFSEVPVEQLETVYLDYQSRTSAALLKYLLKEYWGIQPVLIDAKEDEYLSAIKGTTGALVIGDRALQQRKISSYIYDLGSAWKAVTGLPFVFAAWVSNKKLPEEFIKAFDSANATGLSHIDEIVAAEHYELFDLKRYYNLHLSYHLDDAKRAGLNRFLQLISLQ